VSHKNPVATNTVAGSVTISGAGDQVQSTNQKDLPLGYPSLDGDGLIAPGKVPPWIYLTSTVLEANGLVPTTRTFSDGHQRDYTYLVGGLVVDTLTITFASGTMTTYQSVYTVRGVRTSWTIVP
jgi:hypothetical protein